MIAYRFAEEGRQGEVRGRETGQRRRGDMREERSERKGGQRRGEERGGNRGVRERGDKGGERKEEGTEKTQRNSTTFTRQKHSLQSTVVVSASVWSP